MNKRSNLNPKNQKKVLDLILCDTLKASNQSNIKIWIFFGTLLGYARNKNYIPWDNDIDLATWDHEFTSLKYKKFKSLLSRKNYKITKKKSHITIEKKNSKYHADINLFKKKKIVILKNIASISTIAIIANRLKTIIKATKNQDFSSKKKLFKIFYFIFNFLFKYFLKNYKNYFLKKIIKIEKKNQTIYSISFPLWMINNFKEKKFRSYKILIPYHHIKVLEYIYGKNWKIPKKRWNTFKQNKSLKIIN